MSNEKIMFHIGAESIAMSKEQVEKLAEMVEDDNIVDVVHLDSNWVTGENPGFAIFSAEELEDGYITDSGRHIFEVRVLNTGMKHPESKFYLNFRDAKDASENLPGFDTHPIHILKRCGTLGEELYPYG